MDIVALILMPFATWRITSLLVAERGPFGTLDKFRYFIGIRYNERSEMYGENVIADALTCVWCASVWVGFGFSILYFLFPEVSFWIELPLAMSAGAILVERIING